MAPNSEKRVVADYLATMELLDRMRLQNLAAMTEEEALRQIRALCTAEPPWRERRDWSGLVEQQALFHRGEEDMSELSGVMKGAAEVEGYCRAKGWRFCFIGGIAVQRWGMPRFTQDVDLTLLAGFGAEGAITDAVLQQFPGRLRDARQFALDHRVILARTAGGIDLDFALGAYPFEEEAVGRATPWNIGEGISLTTCSAEDLIIHKVFAARDRDWGDVETVLARQFGQLDLARVRKQLSGLLELKEDAESLGKFEDLVTKVTQGMQRP